MLSAKKIFGFIFLLLFLIIFPSATEAANTSKKATSSAAPVVSPAPLPQLTASQSASLSQAIKDPSSPHYATNVVYNILHTASCIISGFSIINNPCLEYATFVTEGGRLSSVPVLSSMNTSGGLLGSTSNLITSLFVNFPLRSSDYIANMGVEFGIVKEASAQVGGSGNGVLSPVFSLWQTSRNITYAFLIVVFVIIGMMIMLRNKVNPQTVISIQYALPGLVLGLILITFSYFLAALITDLAFLSVNLIGYFFALAQGDATATNLSQKIADENVFTIFSRFISSVRSGDLTTTAGIILGNLQGWANTVIRLALAFVSFQWASGFGSSIGAITSGLICGSASAGLAAPICGALGSAIGGVAFGGVAATYAYNSPATVLGFVIYLILIAVLLYQMFILFFRLVNQYLSIIFLTITAPFYFLIAALPGREDVATTWMRNMLCHTLAFPAVLAVLYFVNFILGSSLVDGINSTNPSPFKVPTNSFDLTEGGLPLLGGLNLDFIRLVLAYGALVATPAIPEIVCRAVGKVGPAGQLIGGEISGAQRSGQQYLDQSRAGFRNIGQTATGPFGNLRPEQTNRLRARWTSAGGFRGVWRNPRVIWGGGDDEV